MPRKLPVQSRTVAIFVKNPSTLQIALGVSIAFHAALLMVRFVDPQRFDRVFRDAPLEVILVNTKSNDKPDLANVIAQASLAGGGELEQGRATSPLPSSAQVKAGDAAEDAQRQSESQPRQQERPEQLLVHTEKALVAVPPPDMGIPASTPAQTAEEEKSRQLSKLMAEIEKRINEDTARPKKRYVSPATREEVYAVYYDALRRKIEDSGTMNFPVMAGKKLYGELTMTMTVNFDGSVLETEIVQSSGNPMLDRRARNIVQGASPFLQFSDAMRRKTDQIVVVSHFNFTRDDSLQTRLTQR